ncbi:MAG: ribosomal protein L7/L12 [Verrucomicrobiota bacterium]|jgi:ribosomal protein L7/L12|nr:ribosomal protein L7/L12 [Verrucomicrobiota bacterium]
MGFFDELKKSLFGEQPQGQQRRRRTSSASSKDKPPFLRKTKEKSRREKKPTKRKTAKKKKAYQPPSTDKTIVIEYLNYAGELKQFVGDPKSIIRKGNHFSVRVAPTFKRISLNRSKTRILKGVPAPAALPSEPLPIRTTTSDTSIIHYTNYEGINKEFKIITGVIDDKGDYVRVRVSPTFKYITLKRTRIGNPEALFESSTVTSAPVEETTPTAPEPEKPEVQPEKAVKPTPVGAVNIVLTGCGLATYDATKVLRELRPDMGSFDLYGMLRDFPQTVAEGLPVEKAEEYKKRFEDAGCTVELS